MKREDLTEKLLDIKREKGWSWKHICEKIGGYSEVLIVGAIMGQMKLTKPQAANAGELFGLTKSEIAMLNETPMRGTPMPPTDPLIYRFYELVMVNGPAWKALIEEDIRRRHHVCDRLRHGDGAAAQPQGRPGQDHDVGQIPAVQILRRQRQRAGIRVQGGVTLPSRRDRNVIPDGAKRRSGISRFPDAQLRICGSCFARPKRRSAIPPPAPGRRPAPSARPFWSESAVRCSRRP